tara:strand:+ start:518 stop:889 length:372 start_codon:yes stop_codon:yes gene_type:complete
MMIFDKPNSVDLLEAVNHFLDTKIKSEVPAHLAFKIRIVENVLNIVKREIEQGDELSKEIMVQLQNLIEEDSPTIDALALLIKDEKIDLEDQGLKDLLVTLSKNKIAVDNPNYSTYKKLLDRI